jgi:hypothetical protein
MQKKQAVPFFFDVSVSLLYKKEKKEKAVRFCVFGIFIKIKNKNCILEKRENKKML